MYTELLPDPGEIDLLWLPLLLLLFVSRLLFVDMPVLLLTRLLAGLAGGGGIVVRAAPVPVVALRVERFSPSDSSPEEYRVAKLVSRLNFPFSFSM